MFDFNIEIIMNIEEKMKEDMSAYEAMEVINEELNKHEYELIHVDRLESSERDVYSNRESIVIVDVIKEYAQQEDFAYIPYYEVVVYVIAQEAYEYRLQFL